jgi:tRNA (guanine37-N1)-methyltransferase
MKAAAIETVLRIDVLTIFPEYFAPFTEAGIGRIAAERGRLSFGATNIRDFTTDAHRTVDDYSFGGGPGMVMKPEPVWKALESVLGADPATGGHQAGTRIVVLTPRGRVFDQEMAAELAREKHLVLVCGHYEGLDERIHELATDEISVGDYVLSGGEPAAAIISDAVIRLLPDVLGTAESLVEESFESGLLEYPQYTRPQNFKDREVPDVLLSGNHGKISRWRRLQAIALTVRRRPDLLARADLNEEETQLAERLLHQYDKERLG